MSYEARGTGYIIIGNQDTEPIINILETSSYMYGEARGKRRITVSYGNNYHENEVEEALTKIKEYTKEGEIDFTGEDGEKWRYVFEDGDWYFEPGEIQYNRKRGYNATYSIQPEPLHETKSSKNNIRKNKDKIMKDKKAPENPVFFFMP